MESFEVLKGIAAPLPMINVDTDMIIPKQFLKTIKRSGLGKNLFHELRFDMQGNIKNDFVLAMTGYQPNYEILEKLGIKILDDEFRTPFYDEQTMETNVKGVYLAGVLCGGLKTNKWFIENSREHSEKIISQIIKD